MRNVVCVWANSRHYAEQELCLIEAARWHQSACGKPIDVLVFEGFEHLEMDREVLSSSNYQLHDASRAFQSVKSRYEALSKTYTQFHLNNLLRWLVIYEYFKEEHILAFDSDLVLTSDIASYEDLRNHTFTSTSTCFVAINDVNWFKGYAAALAKMCDDPDGFKSDWDRAKDDYILAMADQKEVNEESFVRYLIKSNQIPNSFPNDFPYYIVPFNLQMLQSKVAYQEFSLPIHYERRGYHDYFNGKMSAYLHFQNGFKEYLALHIIYKDILQLYPPKSLQPLFRKTNAIGRVDELVEINARLRELCVSGKLGRENRDLFTRRRVMDRFLVETDLSAVFTDFSWYQPGIFEDRARPEFSTVREMAPTSAKIYFGSLQSAPREITLDADGRILMGGHENEAFWREEGENISIVHRDGRTVTTALKRIAFGDERKVVFSGKFLGAPNETNVFAGQNNFLVLNL